MAEVMVAFEGGTHTPVRLRCRSSLSEELDSHNSPLLFGCRTGICGTCLVRVQGVLPPPSADERELLEVLAPGDSQARLACQIELTGDVVIEPHPGG